MSITIHNLLNVRVTRPKGALLTEGAVFLVSDGEANARRPPPSVMEARSARLADNMGILPLFTPYALRVRITGSLCTADSR